MTTYDKEYLIGTATLTFFITFTLSAFLWIGVIDSDAGIVDDKALNQVCQKLYGENTTFKDTNTPGKQNKFTCQEPNKESEETDNLIHLVTETGGGH